MTRDYFAVDLFDPGLLLSDIQALQQSFADAGTRWALMLDMAFDHGRPALALPGEAWQLYKDSDLRGLCEVSPLLVDMGDLARAPGRWLSCLAHVNGRPMLSVLQTRAAAWDEVIARWQSCVYPRTSDGQRLVLRFADTRVSAYLPQALSISNWASLSTALTQWWIIDRSGALRALAVAAQQSERPASKGPMQLDDAELAALIDAGTPDAVIDLLNRELPEILPQNGRAALHATVEKVCVAARAHGVGDFKFTATLCAAVIQRPHLLSEPRFSALLRDARTVTDQHYERLADLGEDEDANHQQ